MEALAGTMASTGGIVLFHLNRQEVAFHRDFKSTLFLETQLASMK
jgi:hypothetical protein